MNTMECVITDLLDCGYMDISMLDTLYSPLAEEIGVDTSTILKDSVELGNGLNGVITTLYNEITYAISNKLTEILEEYTDTLEGGEPTEETRNTILQDLLEKYLYTGEITEENEYGMKALTPEQIEIIEKEIKELENSYPFANCMDSYFQNNLDQTLDDEYGVDENCKYLLEYILFSE